MRTWTMVAALGLLAGGASGCMAPGGKESAGSRSPAVSQVPTYTCTRCGGSQAQPGNCPKCGMALQPVAAPSVSGDSATRSASKK